MSNVYKRNVERSVAVLLVRPGALAVDVAARAAAFAAARGHRPPYWELVTMARESLAARRR